MWVPDSYPASILYEPYRYTHFTITKPNSVEQYNNCHEQEYHKPF